MALGRVWFLLYRIVTDRGERCRHEGNEAVEIRKNHSNKGPVGKWKVESETKPNNQM